MITPVTLVNVGTNPNDNTGDPAQVAFTKINTSLTALSTAVGGGGVVTVSSPDNSLVVAGSPGNTLALQIAQAFTGAFNIVPGTFTYASLPLASSYVNKYAVTTDQGAVFSNGVIWQILFNATQGVLAISSNSPLTSAQQSVAYSQQLTATGGIGSLTWSLVQKTGVNTWALSSTGLLTGTPGTVESDYLVVQASDITGAVAQKTLALTTVAALTPAATPTFSPGTGSYGSSQAVTISCSTGSSTIYYTTNGSTPTTGSTVYSTPVTVAASLTLKAIATAAGFTQSAVGSAAYVIGAAGATMGTNYSQTGTGELAYEGLPTFKNGFRSARHLGTSTGLGGTINTAVALTAAGWPAADFCCQLLSGNILPSWAVGTWKCGFTSLNGGTETISSALGATIANVVHGASTTFDLTPTGANVLFNVTGTTGGVTNIWCYIPAYNTNVGIDNPTTAAAFTNEVIAHYKNYSHIRFMQCVNSWWNTIQATSGNRRSAANCQVAFNVINDFPTQEQSGRAGYNFTATPVAGNTSGTLSTPWALPTGNYAFMFFNGQWIARFVALTNGSTTCNWTAGGGALPAGGAYLAYATIGFERYPIEWFIALCNACNIGIWITQPFYEDGTNGAAGSWTAAVCTYLNANWTSPGNIIFEDGNENWNGSYFNLGMSLAQTTIGAYADFSHYWAFRRHTCANVIRANITAGWWGTRVFQVHGVQSSFGNGPFYQQATYDAMNASWGNPSADVQYSAAAPYTTPVVGSSDTIAVIEANFTARQKADRVLHPFEAETIVGLAQIPRGGVIKMCGYEGGGQWNNVVTTNPNAGATIVDPGYTACVTGLYTRSFLTGLDFNTHTGSGLMNAPAAVLGVVDDLQSSAQYTAFVANAASSSPNYAALASYFGGFTHSAGQRNVVSGSGSILNGYDYSENSIDISSTPFSFSQSGAQIYPHQQNGYGSWVLYCLAPATYALAVTFSTVNAGVQTNVECNGVVLFTNVAVTAGAGPSVVNVGNVTLRAGWNYVTLGHNGAQVATVNQIQFN